MIPIAKHLIFASMQRWQSLAFFLPPLALAVVMLVVAEREGAKGRREDEGETKR